MLGVSFTLLRIYPLCKREGESQCRSGRCGEDEYRLPLLRIESRFLGPPVRDLVAIRSVFLSVVAFVTSKRKMHIGLIMYVRPSGRLQIPARQALHERHERPINSGEE
jgi:hypothetical protein